jgi:hypothetical protein
MSHIFVSHSSKDDTLVREIHDALLATIAAARNHPRLIETALKQAKHLPPAAHRRYR